jgi:S-formylglutathione hydrolase FrmB
MKQGFALRLALTAAFVLTLSAAFGQGVRFTVRYPAAVFAGPFNGRVIVCLSKTSMEPRFGPNWFRPEPMFAQVVSGIKPDESIRVGDGAAHYPANVADIPAGEYFVQAVLDRNLGGRQFGSSVGNLYGDAVKVVVDRNAKGEIALVCDKVVQETPFRETETVKEVRFESKLLSAFYGRPTFMYAAVALPTEWAQEPKRTFPILYEVPGFGGRHTGLSGATGQRQTHRNGEPFLYVLLDPDCPTGHSVFADSANNGPWGKALTTELIPHIEKQFRAVARTEGRFVTGHSSGGWSSLWLQVTYPNVFGGCWSTSPDPVDFRDFQRIDLYAKDANMFTDAAGQPRPLARRGETPVLFYKAFSDMERPLRGEQLGSFEGVFSPRGADGEPRKLWHRDTGMIDRSVAEAWKRYDIGLTLRSHWNELAPKLAGKIHVFTGATDTFYLEGAVKLLQADMKRLGSDAEIEIVPGDHGSMMTPTLRARLDAEMAAAFLAHKSTR